MGSLSQTQLSDWTTTLWLCYCVITALKLVLTLNSRLCIFPPIRFLRRAGEMSHRITVLAHLGWQHRPCSECPGFTLPRLIWRAGPSPAGDSPPTKEFSSPEGEEYFPWKRVEVQRRSPEGILCTSKSRLWDRPSTQYHVMSESSKGNTLSEMQDACCLCIPATDCTHVAYINPTFTMCCLVCNLHPLLHWTVTAHPSLWGDRRDPGFLLLPLLGV